ncbi:3-oxoacyl-ACP synthase [uncultured Croceitalea sp.]|uniref:3-oxoacyl-ACP synthase n=1 Tax=uncultured Croceitalea sp. TaxID=1798908 RepID=UPI00374FA082
MKEEAYQFCKAYILGRLQRITKNIIEINASLNSETKSSAGDKHETGRAMLQLEREKLSQQLLEAEKTAQLLKRVKASKQSNSVILGSLVKTSNATYYIAISAGKFEYKSGIVYCISANTPIGKLLLGKVKEMSFVFNNKEHKILEVN